MKKNMSSKKIITFLLILSLLLTSSTFAYWANYVEGTQTDTIGTLQIGTADSVNTIFHLNSTYNSGGSLVPSSQVGNSKGISVDEILIQYDLEWAEDSEYTQLEGTSSQGQINVSHQVYIYKDDLLNPLEYNDLYTLIHVEYSDINPQFLVLNGDSQLFTFTITMDEPKNQAQYDLISEAEISIEFSFVILENDIETKDLAEQETEDNSLLDTRTNEAYIELIGDELVFVELSDSFVDPGVIAYDSQGNIVTNKWSSGNINTWQVGTYTITYSGYSSYDNGLISPITRTVVVEDTSSPQITMNGNSTFIVEVNTYYNDWGAWAVDNSGEYIYVETNGLEQVDISKVGTYYVYYYAEDSSGNRSEVVRTIIVK